MSASKKIATKGIVATLATTAHGTYNLETSNIDRRTNEFAHSYFLPKKHIEQIPLDKSTQISRKKPYA